MKNYDYSKSSLDQLNSLFLQYLRDDSGLGIIKSIIDGVVVFLVLSKIKVGEMLLFSNNVHGMALNLITEGAAYIKRAFFESCLFMAQNILPSWFIYFFNNKMNLIYNVILNLKKKIIILALLLFDFDKFNLVEFEHHLSVYGCFLDRPDVYPACLPGGRLQQWMYDDSIRASEQYLFDLGHTLLYARHDSDLVKQLLRYGVCSNMIVDFFGCLTVLCSSRDETSFYEKYNVLILNAYRLGFVEAYFIRVCLWSEAKRGLKFINSEAAFKQHLEMCINKFCSLFNCDSADRIRFNELSCYKWTEEELKRRSFD